MVSLIKFFSAGLPEEILVLHGRPRAMRQLGPRTVRDLRATGKKEDMLRTSVFSWVPPPALQKMSFIWIQLIKKISSPEGRVNGVEPFS